MTRKQVSQKHNSIHYKIPTHYLTIGIWTRDLWFRSLDFRRLDQPADKWLTYWQKVSNKTFSFTDTRETGFVNAITAAGVTYAITRACTAGSLLECSCEKVSQKTSYKLILLYNLDFRFEFGLLEFGLKFMILPILPSGCAEATSRTCSTRRQPSFYSPEGPMAMGRLQWQCALWPQKVKGIYGQQI
jgi:hypothetical protein